MKIFFLTNTHTTDTHRTPKLRRALSRILSLLLVLTLIPALTVPAHAETGFILIGSPNPGDGWQSTSGGEEWTDYAITGNVTASGILEKTGEQSSNIIVNNNATLIIDSNLTISGNIRLHVNNGGTVQVSSSATLTIDTDGSRNQGVINDGVLINSGTITNNSGIFTNNGTILTVPPGITPSTTGGTGGNAVPGNLVTVTGGTGGGYYAQGATVNITATVPSGFAFVNWTSSDIGFANANNQTTSFTMPTPPSNPVTVTANYADIEPPTPGNSGTITTTNVTHNSLMLNWTTATDNVTSQANLRYFVYQSTSTMSGTSPGGTLLNTGGTTGITTFPVIGLNASTTYFFIVVVEDEAGNKAAYTLVSQATSTAPTYTANVSPSGTHTFTAQDYHLTTVRAAQQFTITNTGNQPLTNLTATLGGGAGSSFEISAALSLTTVPSPNGTATISIRPKTGLNASATPYTDTLTFRWNNDGGGLTVNLSFTVNKATMTFPAHAAVGATYSPTLTLNDISLNADYEWDTPTTTLTVADDGQAFAAIFTDPSGNYEPVNGSITVNVAKAEINITAISGVTPPVVGAVPVTAITPTTQYTGTVTWDNGNPAVFAANTVYTATITLTPTANYTLTGVNANTFTVAGATGGVTHSANSGVITAVFPQTGQLTVETPTVTPNGGTFTNSVNVTLSTATTDAVIHYTTDGTTPTAASPMYSDAIMLNATTTVQAIAVKAGYADSAVMSVTFTRQGSNNGGSGNGGSWTPPTPSHSFSGGNSTFVLGSNTPLVLTIQKDLSLFREVRVDNNTLTRNTDYTAERGSTIISLLPDYLNTLTAGRHTVSVRFTDGVTVTANFTVAEAPTPITPTMPINPFTDVRGTDWFIDAVIYVYDKGLMTGTSTEPMLFSPNATLTRGMVVTVLYRMQTAVPSIAYANPFDDVDDGMWYADAVKWAYHNDIVSGYGGGKFGPNDNITREQMATILFNYAKFAGIDVSVGENTNILSYNDAFDVSEWAIPAFQWATGAGVVGGKPGGLLDPKGGATRAEFATVLMRFLEAME